LHFVPPSELGRVTVLVAIQAATFVALAVLFCVHGQWRLGVAQALLGAVTGLVYA
jgi:hypothetical protein